MIVPYCHMFYYIGMSELSVLTHLLYNSCCEILILPFLTKLIE